MRDCDSNFLLIFCPYCFDQITLAIYFDCSFTYLLSCVYLTLLDCYDLLYMVKVADMAARVR